MQEKKVLRGILSTIKPQIRSSICTSTLFRPSVLLESPEFNPSLIQHPSLSDSTLKAGHEFSRIHNHNPFLQLFVVRQVVGKQVDR